MDFTLSLSSDWFNLVAFPLIFLTIKDVIPKWKSIWDEHLSSDDRRLLLRMVIFLALPVVVFIHESGHFLAALQVGAKVYDFHYGPVSGYVSVDSNIAPEKLLWIAVAGNLAQVVVGLLALALATILRSAPAVAFLVYLGLFSIGDTVIFYAALSLASCYGDWINIYTSPCADLVRDVAIVHTVLVVFIWYCVNGSAPRLWFSKKTMPEWSAAHQNIAENAKLDPSVGNLLVLADSFVEGGLYKEAARSIRQAESLGNGNAGVEYCKAELEMARGNLEKALQSYEKLAANETISTEMRVRTFLQMGELSLYRRDVKQAIAWFTSAANLDPQQGDARLQKAILSASIGHYDELDNDLQYLRNPSINWIYLRNQQKAPQEIEKLEAINARR